MRRRKWVALATAMTLAVSGLSTGVPASAASKLVIKNVAKGKKTLTVGKTFTIKTNMATKKLKFSSSKPAVAKVTAKGVVKAVKVGSCVIKVKTKGKKKKYVH